MKRDTQAGKVMHMLESNPNGVCGPMFLERHIPRYSARISELRKAVSISRVPCPYGFHSHRTKQYAWKLDPSSQTSML